MSELTIYLGDCLEVMAKIPSGSVDMVLADLPYGVTAAKWDSVIPLDRLWTEYRRVAKPNAAIVLTAAQPFTTTLIASNPKEFRYCWYWLKNTKTGHLNAKKQPLRRVEEVCVFYASQPTYNPQKTTGHEPTRTGAGKRKEAESAYGLFTRTEYQGVTERYPDGVLEIKAHHKGHGTDHPTQKPVALMEYLIKTYTQEGETVLDNTMGSGTTGIACQNTCRRFIGIESSLEYFAVAQNRLYTTHREAAE